MLTETSLLRHEIVSREDWLAARKRLLDKEKAVTRLRDDLAAERRDLPWVRVDKTYLFEGPQGTQSLSDLFEGHSQLIIDHFMFGPQWLEGCPMCSFLADHIDGLLPHLRDRDVAFAAVSRATIEQIEAFKQRMGWHFKWVSSRGNDFNKDYHVSFTPEELREGSVYYNFKDQKYPSEWPSEEAPGLSVFYKDSDGSIFHTYSTFGRGAEVGIGAYQFLDLVPKGRNEYGLPFPMAWVRHHDRYERERAAGDNCHG